jgi:hypothetical protein
MKRCTWLLACALVGLAGCQQLESESPICSAGKCDDPGGSSGAVQQLMPKAPETLGQLSFTRADDRWFFEIIGDRGDVLLQSDTEYTQQSSAVNGALATRQSGVDLDNYSVFQTGSGWTFELRAANNVPLATGQLFASEAAANDGAAHTRDVIASIVQYDAARADGARFALDREGATWGFELRDANGDTLLTSQIYQRRADAINGIDSVRENGRDEGRYEVIDDGGAFRFVLDARNGQEIAQSGRTYATRAEAEAAVLVAQQLLYSERVANPW